MGLTCIQQRCDLIIFRFRDCRCGKTLIVPQFECNERHGHGHGHAPFLHYTNIFFLRTSQVITREGTTLPYKLTFVG